MTSFNADSTGLATTHSQISLTDKQCAELLAGWSYPSDPAERQVVDSAATTPSSSGRVLCWRRRQRCNNLECCDPETEQPHRFRAMERELWNCPICGKDRHCRIPVQPPNRGCHHHGGATPQGWDLPQTRHGQSSKYIKVDSLQADFEKMLASPQLEDLTEDIALVQVRLNEIQSQYSGGASKGLLKDMKLNRKAYKTEARKDTPDTKRLNQLDRDLDTLIAAGSKPYQVMDDWGRSIDRKVRLIAARDSHIEKARQYITADKAWMMLRHSEETVQLGLAMMLVTNDERIDKLLERMDIHFAEAFTEQERMTMRQGLWEDQNAIKKKILAYVSKRFKELAGSGQY